MRISKITLNGKTRSLKKWADRIGIPYQQFCHRYYTYRRLHPKDSVRETLHYFSLPAPLRPLRPSVES